MPLYNANVNWFPDKGTLKLLQVPTSNLVIQSKVQSKVLFVLMQFFVLFCFVSYFVLDFCHINVSFNMLDP